jgi:hypothetical protein
MLRLYVVKDVAFQLTGAITKKDGLKIAADGVKANFTLFAAMGGTDAG